MQKGKLNKPLVLPKVALSNRNPNHDIHSFCWYRELRVSMQAWLSAFHESSPQITYEIRHYHYSHLTNEKVRCERIHFLLLAQKYLHSSTMVLVRIPIQSSLMEGTQRVGSAEDTLLGAISLCHLQNS